MISFEEMGLDALLLKAVDALGFKKPTPIQEEVIPRLLSDKRDLVALAQTGTGKTAAFGLPLVQHADPSKQDIQGLVLCPTRELCMQITTDLNKFAQYRNGFRTVAVYGGASIDKQIKDLKKGVQIVVGTPGRTLDLIKKKHLYIDKIQTLVLDEADEMLNMGFKEDIDAILLATPDKKQTLLFSATMPVEIERIAARYMHKPDEIAAGHRNTAAENIRHEYYVAPAKFRYEVLKRIADMNPRIYGIVFCRTRHEAKEVADKFMHDGYNADALHGDLSQSQRDFVMNRFRKGHLQMLIATDVAARGLDVNNLTHVINYNLPDDLEIYIHRSGRTGRAGKSGTSISILHTRETNKIRSLEKITSKSFKRKAIPEGREICKKQLFNLIDKVEKVELNEDQIEGFLPEIHKKLSWLSREDLIKHFVSVEFNRFLSYYKDAPDLNLEIDSPNPSKSKKEGFRVKEKTDSGRRTEFTRFFINLGKKDKLNASNLIGLLNDQTRNRNIEIGKIDILGSFSFFEVDKRYEDVIRDAFSGGANLGGKKVQVELSNPEEEKPKKRKQKKFRSEKKSRKPGSGKKY